MIIKNRIWVRQYDGIAILHVYRLQNVAISRDDIDSPAIGRLDKIAMSIVMVRMWMIDGFLACLKSYPRIEVRYEFNIEDIFVMICLACPMIIL